MVTQINTAITNMPRNTAITNMPSIINSNTAIKTHPPPDPRDPNYQAGLKMPRIPELNYNPHIDDRFSRPRIPPNYGGKR